MTRVYLIRHADVENPQRVLYGHLPGFPLSARGREQAAALGRRLRDGGIRRIFHSPLERAEETARIAAAQLEGAVELIPEFELRESEFSRYLQGVPFWQIPLRRPGRGGPLHRPAQVRADRPRARTDGPPARLASAASEALSRGVSLGLRDGRPPGRREQSQL